MGTTAYGNSRRERAARIRSAEAQVATAAARWVEALDERNSDYASGLLNGRLDERREELIAATRVYMAEFPVNPNYNRRASREEVR